MENCDAHPLTPLTLFKAERIVVHRLW